MSSIIEPYAWVGLKLPSESVRFLRIAPNTNLLLNRPYHLTYELQDKLPGEDFCRLRVVPPSEFYVDVFAEEAAATSSGRMDSGGGTPLEDAETAAKTADASAVFAPAPPTFEYTLIDEESQAVIARSNRDAIDANSRQTLTTREIEELKREGTDAGKDLIAKLMLSHGALDQKTTFSLAKYKLLKTRKYIRRFSVLPLDVPSLSNWLLEDKEVGPKIMDLRDEMLGLLGCWANVHYGGADVFQEEKKEKRQEGGKRKPDEDLDGEAKGEEAEREDVVLVEGERLPQVSEPSEDLPGRWLVVDDTGGLLVAAMAERMGVLMPPSKDEETSPALALRKSETTAASRNDGETTQTGSTVLAETATSTTAVIATPQPQSQSQLSQPPPLPLQSVSALAPPPNGNSAQSLERRPHMKHRYPEDDFQTAYSQTNTITLVHANTQPNLAYLKYFGFDHADPNPPPQHPLAQHLLSLSWLQLLEPASDSTYAQPPPNQPPEVVASWKPARRGNYHRKRRRWARMHYIVDMTRRGGFAGLVLATSMDLVSALRHTLPLLAGGAPVAVYSPTLEPLVALADCFSIGRRTAWLAPGGPPDTDAEWRGRSAAELEQWPGTDAFPLNPMMLLNVSVQTSRARKWQVLPGRTHPLMTARGGSEGYVLTGWKSRPAEGRVTARGKFKRRKTGAEAGP